MNNNTKLEGEGEVQTQNSSYIHPKVCGIPPDGVPPESNKWEVLKSMCTALNSINAEYAIHAGTLLGWYRSCSLFDGDIDLTLSLSWWENHVDELEVALRQAGFKFQGFFSKRWKVGYEEAWTQNKVKVDLFSRDTHDTFYIWSLTTGSITYGCHVDCQQFVKAKWDTLDIFVPYPVEPALVSMYGIDWREPKDDWHWWASPFSYGNCSKSHILS